MTMRLALSRQRWNGVAAGALVALAFVVAGLNDRGAAWAAAHEGRLWRAVGVFVSRFGLSGYMLVVSASLAFGAMLVLRRTGRSTLAAPARRIAERAVFFFAAIAASGLVCQALKHVVGRARPRFLDNLGAYHFAGPTLHSGYESFPSGHSTTAFAAALALTLLRPAWSVILYPAAVLICVSRVFAAAHYPSDTLAGALLGTLVTLWVARTFAKRDIAFTVSDPLPLAAVRRRLAIAQDKDARAL